MIGPKITLMATDGRRYLVEFDDNAAWIENEKGEKAMFATAEELVKELFEVVDNLFKSKQREVR